VTRQPAEGRQPASPATWFQRLASIVYETLLVVAIVFIAALLFPGAVSDRLSGVARHALAGYVIVVVAGYFVWFWSRGQTLAMRAWRLRVVDAGGHFPTPARALARYAAGLVLIIPGCGGALWLREHPDAWPTWGLVAVAAITLAWPLWDRQRRALYDVIAGTRLVRLTDQ